LCHAPARLLRFVGIKEQKNKGSERGKRKEKEVSPMKKLIVLAVLAALGLLQGTFAQAADLDQRTFQRVTKEVHHELALLPYYGVFDNLAYKVSPDGTVTLLGQVVNPVTKSDAQRAVKGIESVERVDNQIEILPPSPMDDGIRRQTFRAIYSHESLAEYSTRAMPPIHIIVKNGHVTLVGVVANKMDKEIAEIQAKSVPDVFSVDDQLQVEDGK
jgi:hyperosmotically inducible protein